MEFVQFNCKRRNVDAIMMYRLDKCDLPYVILCPNCKEFLLEVLTPAHGTARMTCAECGKDIQITFAGK